MQRPDDAPAIDIDATDEAFELAPVSLWLEDLSGVKALFAEWAKAGVTCLTGHIRSDPRHLTACLQRIRVIRVNRATLTLFDADSMDQLVANFAVIVREEAIDLLMEELTRLWDGHRGFFGQTINYTLGGRKLDVQINGTILPGHEHGWERVLVAVQDVTALETARREIGRSEAYARGLFEHSPVALWVKDYSAVKTLVDELRAAQIGDIRGFIDGRPDFVDRCVASVRMRDINRQALHLFGMASKSMFLEQHHDVFRRTIRMDFEQQLVGLWEGRLFQERESVVYARDGTLLHVHLQFSVLPGHEHDWSRIQVGRIDITARKQAENQLRYVNEHDLLTGLRSRAFHVAALRRLTEAAVFPVTIIVADLNGLKTANDRAGHACGDAMLRCVARVMNELVQPPGWAARTGGDEFVIILPKGTEAEGHTLIAAIRRRLQRKDAACDGFWPSLSMGQATSLPGETLDDVSNRADALMYEAKRLHYASGMPNRRGIVPAGQRPRPDSAADGQRAAAAP